MIFVSRCHSGACLSIILRRLYFPGVALAPLVGHVEGVPPPPRYWDPRDKVQHAGKSVPTVPGRQARLDHCDVGRGGRARLPAVFLRVLVRHAPHTTCVHPITRVCSAFRLEAHSHARSQLYLRSYANDRATENRIGYEAAIWQGGGDTRQGRVAR